MPGIFFSLLSLQCHISKWFFSPKFHIYVYICVCVKQEEVRNFVLSKEQSIQKPLRLASQQQLPSKTNLFRGLLLSLSVEEDQTRDDLKYSNLYKMLGWWEWLSNVRLIYTHEVSSLSESICSSHFGFSCLESHGYSTFILMSFFVVLSLGNHYTLYIYECMWKKNQSLPYAYIWFSFLKNSFSKKWVILRA